jgi:hypothetical protein
VRRAIVVFRLPLARRGGVQDGALSDTMTDEIDSELALAPLRRG